MAVTRAVLFDLDGTLIDSELYTDRAIAAITSKYGAHDFALPTSETRGRTWKHIAQQMIARAVVPADRAEAIAADLLAEWNAAAIDVKPIPGAPEAVRDAAAAKLLLGVVSSSPRSVIDNFLVRLGVAEHIAEHARIGAEAVRTTKPDPEGYLLAARALEVAPSECLVFEDSRAGLLAARAAGMRSIFVTCCASDIEENTALAAHAYADYRALPPRFFDDLSKGSG